MSNTRWDDLSVELWVHILSHLYKRLDPLGQEDAWHHWGCVYYAQKLNNTQKLRLVCRKLMQPWMMPNSRTVWSCQIPSKTKTFQALLQWVHRHCNAVRMFLVAAGSPTLEATLSALACPGSQLILACVPSISTGAVHVLSCHSGLQTITIDSTAVGTFADLSPLAALPCLKELSLREGNFSCEATLSHLTRLRLSGAEILFTNACFCGSSLVHLSLRGSLLDGCDQGLSGCQNLTDWS
ncbi:hypothetical protein ABBQ32_005005 [Trebouxia sp. C0010 RCD-2024]